MADGKLVEITGNVVIPIREFSFRFSKSGGPGGQHVNKTETRVEVSFDVSGSPSLSAEQKERILSKLSSRIDTRGILKVDAQDTRSQRENRILALQRISALLAQALKTRKKRIPTKPGPLSNEQRLAVKKKRGLVKKSRRGDED